MNSAQKQLLKAKINRSSLLTAEKKHAIEEVLDILNNNQIGQLEKMLNSEAAVIQSAASFVIEKAVTDSDQEILGAFDQFFTQASSKLRRTDEVQDRAEDAEQVEHLFDSDAA